jgi:polysaccharide export outer membrane protein
VNDGSFKAVEEIEYTIQKNDILSIYITSLNEEASKIFNTANNFVINSSTASGGSAQSSGYLVNLDGNIQLPILGNIKAAGLTKREIKENITKILLDKKLLIDPIVNIRHINYEVTVIGEVGKPTVITVPNEKITMLKALGLSGDITTYGKKNNVLLIREKEGKKNVVRIDLNSSNFLTSPYYYLQPNDVVYVETNKNKIANNSRALLIIPSLLGSLAILAATIIQVVR